ncbi:IS3 family transposase [Lacticaseibacillus paracasei]|uniref:IS3 family transposase n=1 Tax=Lacticaseibacillus paracasei TaxID=1597 RepID=UPI0025A15D87|nr:IS3 family transposase [Lacticaseibacillus paracasei]MDM7527919.1 integrase core domain-containing protein [Lacticaseibacillus paracasei]
MNPDAGKFYGISTACRMMGVSRAAYYKWTHRKVTVHEQENQAIRDYIIELEEKNHDIFGVKRLMTYINAETQYHVGHGQVRRIMRLAGITHSMSRPGTPGDNSPMESLWRHLKIERFAFEHCLSELEMMKRIEAGINWYNNERRQETLNGMTPMTYRNHAVKKLHRHFNYFTCLLDADQRR